MHDILLHDLNPEQRLAVTHGDGPLLIVAGAGTGKTTTLAHRVAYHIASGVDPRRILLLTFTRRASAEMLKRVDAIVRKLGGGEGEQEEGLRALASELPTSPSGVPAEAPCAPPPARPASVSGRVWGGTFHAVATRLLRMHGDALGLDPGFTILDRTDSEDLMGVVRTELGLSRTDRRFPGKGACLDVYSRCVNAQERIDEVLATRFPWCREHAEDLGRLFSAYVDRKSEQAVLDYDDLLLFWRGLLQDPVAAEHIGRRFDRVLVDEYQDTNVLQSDILRALMPDGLGLTVVGDDAQSVYGFRAATVRNILDFPTHFSGTEVVTLTRNYRSTGPILEATNAVIALSSERYEKDLIPVREGGEAPWLVSCRDEDEQTDFVVEQVLANREAGVPLHEQAVLFRASHHSLGLEVELGRRDVPYHKYGGLKFMETAHVKDLLAFLRLAENPRDLMAGTRVLGLLPGIGPSTARKLMDLLRASDDGFDAWLRFDPPVAAKVLWPGFVEMMTELASADPGPLASQVSRVRAMYSPIAEQRYDTVSARLRDLEQIENLTARFPDRARMLTDMVLDPPAWTGDLAGPPHLDDDWLVLSTMHSAKGLEWSSVYVIHAADGNIPSDMATGRAEEIEEERRLFYVACSRAKDRLYVTHPLRYYKHPRGHQDTYGHALPTRFLPERIRPAFHVTPARPMPEAAEDGTAPSAISAAEIRRSMKALW